MNILTHTLAFPQAQQVHHFPDAVARDCPVCFAKAGEPCMPASLSIPHLARCRDEKRDGSAA